jgi:hypothetical protein
MCLRRLPGHSPHTSESSRRSHKWVGGGRTATNNNSICSRHYVSARQNCTTQPAAEVGLQCTDASMGLLKRCSCCSSTCCNPLTDYSCLHFWGYCRWVRQFVSDFRALREWLGLMAEQHAHGKEDVHDQHLHLCLAVAGLPLCAAGRS